MACKFDEKNIVFSFAAISDIHITVSDDDSVPKFRSALSALKERSQKDGKGLDAVFIVGDLIDSKLPAQIENFKKVYESELDPEKVPPVYCLGDGHDLMWAAENVSESVSAFRKIFGEKWFLYDVGAEDEEGGTRHCIINGRHVIALQPVHRVPIFYSDNVKEYLDRTLSEITAAEPDKHVFIITHPMIHDTCYGSTLGEEWDTSDITSVLSKYPQAVVFGGHLHFPLNDERSICETEFTSLGCGAVRYMAIENGYMNEHGCLMRDGYRFSQGLLCQVDSSDRIRFIRMDFNNKSEIKKPWVIGTVSGKEKTYTRSRGMYAHKPRFAYEACISLMYGKNQCGGRTVMLTFPSAYDTDFIHHYEIRIKNKNGTEIINKTALADFYRHPYEKDMKKEVTVDICDMLPGVYTVDITAVNSWDKKSKALCESVELNFNE